MSILQGGSAMDEGAVKEHLMKNDERFRQLADEHRQFDQKLKQFSGKAFLTPDEQVQETVIKKKKLALKDQMQSLIHSYRAQHQSVG
jgi:uncharacterized protein YdcH (DUF465 family)